MPNEQKPIGFSNADMELIRLVLIKELADKNSVLNEEQASHAARLIHRLGRINKTYHREFEE